MADSVIVFEGVCMLCSRWLDFVLRLDPHGRYEFAAMQTASGRALLIEDKKGYTDTDAIVRILRSFGPFGRGAACRVPTADVADRFLH
jgi:predicted DCC family thiol-disulfide oxidoreductase YuxK